MGFFFNRSGKTWVLPAAAFFANGSLAAVLRAEETLTLAQAVQRALAHNPELAVDVPARNAAHALVKASRAAYLPRIDFEQSYIGSNNPVYVFGTLLSQGRFTQANFDLHSLILPRRSTTCRRDSARNRPSGMRAAPGAPWIPRCSNWRLPTGEVKTIRAGFFLGSRCLPCAFERARG